MKPWTDDTPSVLEGRLGRGRDRSRALRLDAISFLSFQDCKGGGSQADTTCVKAFFVSGRRNVYTDLATVRSSRK